MSWSLASGVSIPSPDVPARDRAIWPPGSARRWQSRGVGQLGQAVAVAHAARTPRSPAGKTSGRFMTKIKNISAVQTPIPLTAVKDSRDRLVVPGVVELVERQPLPNDGLGQG